MKTRRSEIDSLFVQQASQSLMGDFSVPLILDGLMPEQILVGVVEGLLRPMKDGVLLGEADILAVVHPDAWDIAYCLRAMQVVDEWHSSHQPDALTPELRYRQELVRANIRNNMPVAAVNAGIILALMTVIAPDEEPVS